MEDKPKAGSRSRHGDVTAGVFVSPHQNVYGGTCDPALAIAVSN